MGRQKSPQHDLGELFEASPQPVYVLDDRWRVVYCNPSCADWLEVPVEDIIGLRCTYQASRLELSSALCPPPEAFEGRSREGRILWQRGSDVEERLFQFVPLGSEVDCVGVIAVGRSESSPLDDKAAELVELDSAELHHQLQLFARKYRNQFGLDRLAGISVTMARVRAQVQVACKTEVNVLVVGPTGVGREQVARTIHYGQPAMNDALPDDLLLPLDCARLDHDAIVTTLEAFVDQRQEMGTQANSSLLLLSIDELTEPSQERLIALMVAHPSLRILATTQRDLAASALKKELLERLATLVIELPALADRSEDIPYVAQQVLETWNAQGGRQMSGFVPEVLDRLITLPWRGNIDELTDVVQQACRQASGAWIREEDLPERVRALLSASTHSPPEEETMDLDAFLEEVEREVLWRALKQARGNKSQAARLVSMNRARLLRRLAHLGLDEE